VSDNPKNSQCIKGFRFIPIKLLDVAGLVPGAHEGKGLGNKFLSELVRADVLLHIIDITGSLDKNGNKVEPGSHDPYDDVIFLENEINLWFKGIIEREDWTKFTKTIKKGKGEIIDALYQRLSGLSVKKEHIEQAIKLSKLTEKHILDWDDEDILLFSQHLREISKPIIIVANKIDKEIGLYLYKQLKSRYDKEIIVCSALAEYFLRKYNEEGIIEYIPGDSDFKILQKENLKSNEIETLEKIKLKLFKDFGGTGIQEVLNYAVFTILSQIAVYPVSNLNTLADKDGNVLPDVFLIPQGTKLRDFIEDKIHTDLAKHFIYGMEARNKIKLGENYVLKDNDVIKIFSAK
jgi:ribosome-binding ATPase YchF (GTP1/OBG family)